MLVLTLQYKGVNFCPFPKTFEDVSLGKFKAGASTRSMKQQMLAGFIFSHCQTSLKSSLASFLGGGGGEGPISLHTS